MLIRPRWAQHCYDSHTNVSIEIPEDEDGCIVLMIFKPIVGVLVAAIDGTSVFLQRMMMLVHCTGVALWTFVIARN